MRSQLIKRWRAGLRRLGGDQRGTVMAMVGLLVIPLFAAMGLAIDAGRGYMLRSKLSYAIDAAGLAGGRSFNTDLREADIAMFFEANFPDGYMGAQLAQGHPLVTFDDSNNTITIEAQAVLPTSFMTVAGVSDLTVSARTVVQRELRGLELALVMDNTGSMRSGGKIDAMKNAATTLIEILYGSRDEVENFWVALVPYAATVNIGNQHDDWLDDYDAADFAPTTWKGCVEARDYPNDSNDALPATEGWTAFLWESTLEQFENPDYDPDETEYDENDSATWGQYLNGDNQWDPDGPEGDIRDENSWQNDGTGPNLGCGPAITPLVAEKDTVLAAIDEMLPWHRGGTMANLGLAWSWRVLSPQWRGMWGGDTPAGLPLDYDEPNMTKVVILLTDGVNEWYDWPGAKWREDGEDHYSGLPGNNAYPGSHDDEFKAEWPGADYTAYGRLNEGRLGTTSNSGAKAVINERMLELCTAMKEQDIVIYTITFQVSDNATKDMYRNCATDDDFYFNSPSNSQLDAAFQQIADELSNLRIAE